MKARVFARHDAELLISYNSSDAAEVSRAASMQKREKAWASFE